MKNLKIAIASIFITQGLQAAAPDVTGKITFENAKYSNELGKTVPQTSNHGNDNFKNELSARIYLDGQLGESGDSYHVEVQAYNDSKGIGKYDSNESYTQRDVLREAYVDTTYGDWAIRAGKQQTVWGKTDGMKLLDIINPTDYSEMAQNQMEDSRIPVFMLNAEKYNDDGSSIQAVVSQPKENIFAGFNRHIDTSSRNNGTFAIDSYTNTTWSSASNFSQWNSDVAGISNDAEHPFVLKGVDTITGKKNGFINIVPDMGTVAALFGRAFAMNGSDDTYYAATGFTSAQQDHQAGLAPTSHGGAHTGFTVGNFNKTTKLGSYSNQLVGATSLYINNDATGASGYGFEETNLGTTFYWLDDDGNPLDGAEKAIGSDYANDGAGNYWTGQAVLGAFAGKFGTNLNNMNTSANDSVFEFMDRASFATFDAFVNARSEYVYDMPDDTDLNLAMRYNNTLKSGLNYSLAYSYNYDQNPVIDLSWRDTSGNEVIATRASGYNSVDTDSDGAADKVYTTYITLSGLGGGAAETAGDDTKYATLRFTETLKRAHNIGGAVDYALETDSLGPIVLRAEGLYQKDVYSPIIDRGAMSIGDITSALQMKKGDKFKYALGADITVLTDMMVSTQFIQERNLDYVDNNIDWDGSTCSVDRTGYTNRANYHENCGVYTADFASMHMSNGFKKADKNKNFYSLYLSKPYGESKQHRVNNITIFEQGGGRWNRIDTEYTINDNTTLNAEWNRYWGDNDTQFGQLERSSNVQLGMKYIF